MVTCCSEDTDYTFVLNRGTAPLPVAVPQDAVDLSREGIPDGFLTLPRYGVAVLATSQTGAVPFIGRAS